MPRSPGPLAPPPEAASHGTSPPARLGARTPGTSPDHAVKRLNQSLHVTRQPLHVGGTIEPTIAGHTPTVTRQLND